MTGSSDKPADIESVHVDSLPDRLSDGATVLVATAGDPSQAAACLRILSAEGVDGDTAFVVTTRESADQTLEVYRGLEKRAGGPSIGIVDTVSSEQSVPALHGETHVVFTPSPGDLERLVIALSDLSESSLPTSGAQHLVIRSLTPVLDSAPTDQVETVLERITGLRSEAGLGLIGIDYTAHDEETMAAIANCVDGVLWVTQPSNDRLAIEYQPTNGRHRRFVAEGPGADGL